MSARCAVCGCTRDARVHDVAGVALDGHMIGHPQPPHPFDPAIPASRVRAIVKDWRDGGDPEYQLAALERLVEEAERGEA